MEIKEIISYYLNGDTNIIEVSFRTIEDEETIELDEDELIVFLNEYYLINPSQLPKSEFY
jgi:hypothetical protein